MSFVKMPGIEGMVFVPEATEEKKKHDCEDCFACQMCSDDRCRRCLKNKCRVRPDETRD